MELGQGREALERGLASMAPLSGQEQLDLILGGDRPPESAYVYELLRDLGGGETRNEQAASALAYISDCTWLLHALAFDDAKSEDHAER